MSAEYIVSSHDRWTGDFIEILPYNNLQGEVFMNKDSGLRFDLPLNKMRSFHKDTIGPGVVEIWVTRNGKRVWAGPLMSRSINTRDDKINISAASLSTYLKYRRIDELIEHEGSLADLAWSLIADSQAKSYGNLRISRGAQPASKPSTAYKIKKYDMLGKTLDELSEAPAGFDWILGPDRKYNQYYPRINSRANVQLDYPGSIAYYASQTYADGLTNDGITGGPGDSVSTTYANTTSKARYGLWEGYETNTDMITQFMLNSYNQQFFYVKSSPKFVPQVAVNPEQVNPFEGDIELGQVTRVRINNGLDTYDENMRMTGFQFTIGKQNTESITLYLNDTREVT